MNYNYEQQKIYLTDFINSLSLERNLSGKTIYAYKSDYSINGYIQEGRLYSLLLRLINKGGDALE